MRDGRAEFEKFVADCYFMQADKYYSSGNYHHPLIGPMWFAWQAARPVVSEPKATIDQPTCEMKLLPCPYCGTSAELLDGVSNVMGKTYQDFTVCCSTPRCYGNTAYHWHRTARGARLAWNQRLGQLKTDIGARKES